VVSTPDPPTDPSQGVASGTSYVTAKALPFLIANGDEIECFIDALYGNVTDESIGHASWDGGTMVATAVVHASDHDQISLECVDITPGSAGVAVQEMSLTAVSVSQSHEGVS
jgi:hypothetical protein